jgi:trigger factor
MRRKIQLKAIVSEPESWKRVIDIEIPNEEVNAAFDEKLSKYRKDMKLPGFRPGKVPVALIKQRFGESIKAEIIDELVQKSFKDACEKNNINPVAPAKVNDLKNPGDAPLSISIETEIDPDIDIAGYNSLNIKMSPKKVQDSDVDDAFKNILDRTAEFKDIDRPSKKGDYVKIEYLSVIVDGERKSEFKNPQYPIEIGAEKQFKEFDKGLTGHSAGEIVDISVKFPKDYAQEDVAGKTVEFQVKIVAVQEKILPEVNEEFLKKMGNFADEAAFKEHLKTSLENESVKRAKEEAHEQAISMLVNNNPFDVPPARIEQFIDYVYQDALQQNPKGSPEPAREEFAEKYRDVAINAIKRRRIIDFIAKKENIKATQTEVDEEIQKLAEYYNSPFEQMKQIFRQNGTTNRFRDEIKERKTLDFLIGEYTPDNKE